MTEDDPEAESLRAMDRHERRYRAGYLAAPQCSDPDHPGCIHCEPDDFQTNED